VEALITLIMVAIGGVAFGGLIATVIAARRTTALTERATLAEATLTSERTATVEKISTLQAAALQMREVFAAESRDALKANKVALDQQQRRVDELERERQKAYGSIETLLVRMTSDQNQLQSETANLVKALRQPQVRGRWGEIQLRQVVELAGMSNMCDFDEQQTMQSSPELTPSALKRNNLPNRRATG
jgi:DNA recombination protein RmuC